MLITTFYYIHFGLQTIIFDNLLNTKNYVKILTEKIKKNNENKN